MRALILMVMLVSLSNAVNYHSDIQPMIDFKKKQENTNKTIHSAIYKLSLKICKLERKVAEYENNHEHNKTK